MLTDRLISNPRVAWYHSDDVLTAVGLDSNTIIVELARQRPQHADGNQRELIMRTQSLQNHLTFAQQYLE